MFLEDSYILLPFVKYLVCIFVYSIYLHISSDIYKWIRYRKSDTRVLLYTYNYLLSLKLKNCSKYRAVALPLTFFFAFSYKNSFFFTQPRHFFIQFTTIYTTFTNKSLKHLDNINVTNKNYTMINKLLNFHSKFLQLLFIITLPQVVYHVIMSWQRVIDLYFLYIYNT